MSTKKSTQLPRIYLIDLAHMSLTDVFAMVGQCPIDVQEEVLALRRGAVKALRGKA